MAGTMRKERLARDRQTALESMGVWPETLGRRTGLRIPPIYFLLGFLFSLLLLLPLAWGVYPISYYLGYVSTHDIVSRVNFEWRDSEEEERRIALVRENHPRIYREEGELKWVSSVSGPIWPLMAKAAEIESEKTGVPEKTGALLAYAKEKGLELKAAQAEILVRELQAKREWFKPYRHVAVPMQDIIRERIHRRGLLDAEHYQAERNRVIQVQGQGGMPRQVRVGDEASGPVDPEKLRGILDEGFSNEMDRLSVEFRTTLRDILLQRMEPSLAFLEAESQADLQRQISEIRSQTHSVRKGDLLLSRGETVSGVVLRKLRREEGEFRRRLGWKTLVRRFVGKGVLVLSIVLGFILYLCVITPTGWTRDRTAWGTAFLMGMLATAAYLAVQYGQGETLVPIGILAGVVGLIQGGRTAVLAVTASSLILMVLFEGRPGVIGGFLASGWLFACVVRGIRHRLTLLSAAALSGVVAALVMITWGLAVGESPELSFNLETWARVRSQGYLVVRAVYAFAMWTVSGLLLLLLLPTIERIFDATTNISLQELQDQEQPCLKQLVVQAPGTYHHSVIVSTLAEAAAQAVGANPLLARVGSYYHDVGKLMKPEYFAENEAGVSRHDSLSPTMSTLIIIAHVKDGAEMAREYRLPRTIVDIVEQHHGKGLVSFFHHRAKKQAAEGESVSEEAFRYPGPIPQFMEAALVMLADSVEAASRAMERPTPAHIRKRIREIIMNRLLDRQLAASGLTLSDLNKIEDAFMRILTSMFHGRVKYPGQETEGSRKARP